MTSQLLRTTLRVFVTVCHLLTELLALFQNGQASSQHTFFKRKQWVMNLAEGELTSLKATLLPPINAVQFHQTPIKLDMSIETKTITKACH